MGKKSIANGAVVGSDIDTIVPLTAGASVTADANLGGIFKLTPAQATTLNAANLTNGERFSVVLLTSGTTAYTVTFGAGFKTTGTLSTGAADGKYLVVNFVTVDGFALETGRSSAAL